jgi:Sulfotransferase family
MVKQIILPNPSKEPVQALYEKELVRLRRPGALRQRLAEFDTCKPLRRIYVMGVGRSGTWLLTHVMATFFDVEVVPRELPVEYFGLLMTDRSVLVIKRDGNTYQRIQQIPANIEIVYIVRHPYDVLTSYLPNSPRPYFVRPERWVGQLTALRHLLDSQRKNIKVVRYEDLVRHPVEWQKKLEHFFRLKIRIPINTLYTTSNNPSESPLHRSRKIDVSSIDKHKRDPAKLSYLSRIKPQLGEVLDWVAKTYDYDLRF